MFFSPRDPTTGHEFAVGEFSDCSGTGWIMVSTTEDCTYQKTGVAPQFFYSLTDTVAHLAPGIILSAIPSLESCSVGSF